MASDIFSPGFVTSPSVLDRIQRGERIHDNLPRKRYHAQDKPEKKNSGDTPPEDINTSEEDGTEERRLDLRA